MAYDVRRRSPQEIKQALDHGEKLLILDVRQPGDYAASPQTIRGAYRVEPDDLGSAFDSLPPGARVVAFCSSPNEETSARVARYLLQNGYQDVSVLQGGYTAWQHAGLPTGSKQVVGAR